MHAERQAVFLAGQSRHCVAGFDPAPAISAILARAPAEVDAGLSLELAFEQDFAVLDGDSATLPWLCVCNPSHWAPEDKLGLHFAALHARVADSAALLAASRQLVQLVTAGECWERFVWTVSPSCRYDQHPRRHPRTRWPSADDVESFAANCFLRTERQTFFPVGQGTRQAVFTIQVSLQPLAQALNTSADARRLHDAIASMSQTVLDYKNLAEARAPLLSWLSGRS